MWPPSAAVGLTARPVQRQQPPQSPKEQQQVQVQVTASPERVQIQHPPRSPHDHHPRRTKTGGRGTGGTGLGKAKLWVSAGAPPKPLLPVTERTSHEEVLAGRRGKKSSQDDGEKWDITPDGGSAGREGRQFAVANVGNNGRIFLRPTVRPANQRYPQPPFVFPMTPPGTAGLENLASEQRLELERDAQADLPPRDWTPSQPPLSSSPSLLGRGHPGDKQARIRQRHRRAMSDSTIPDTSIARESEPGGFKVVITQPGDDQRPRTVDENDLNQVPPLLEVAIPSWRIGTPRFSIRGTPFIRGSSYAPTEEARTSSTSFLRLTPLDGQSSNGRRRSFFRSSGMLSPSPDPSNPMGYGPARLPMRPRIPYVLSHLVIEPAMFDDLTFGPACDDRTIVRYSTAGAVTAATPPRLVAEITSPSFVDYELLSDFFLTYRSFLESSDLVRMLFARLRWALSRADEVGQVVRVRTFVALRHWILNYFMDDFLVDYSIRVTFCSLLNELMDDFAQDPAARKVPLKILAELKKCWRRVCTQFWDGPEFDTALGPDVPVTPGGIAGNRDSRLDPTFWAENNAEPPQLEDLIFPASPRGHISFYGGVARAGHIDAVVAGDRPATPENGADADNAAARNGAISPTSITSVDVVSCSFPTKSMRPMRPAAGYPAAHPVNPSSMTTMGPVATTPRALMGKRAARHMPHKRSGSLSDSLRENPTTEKGIYKNAEFLLTLPYSGSLVRGDIMPPSQALVEVHPPNMNDARHTTIFQHPPADLTDKEDASAMSGQGMKKLLGSVRRALSTKGQQHLSPTQGTFGSVIAPDMPRGATTNRLPGTPIVPQFQGYHRARGGRPPVRIDLLGAEVAEDFKKAVREDSLAQSEQSEQNSERQSEQQSPVREDAEQQPAGLAIQGQGSSDTHLHPAGYGHGHGHDYVLNRPTSDMGITTGSQSIVIVDDTYLGGGEYPVMTGAIGVANSGMEGYSEGFAVNGAADPTPPNTPPGQAIGVDGETYLLDQHVPHHHHPSASDPLPPFVPDMETLGRSERPSEDQPRPSSDFLREMENHTHTQSVAVGEQAWGRPESNSNRSYASDPSYAEHPSYTLDPSQRRTRRASIASGVYREPTVRSFDATTVSGQSDIYGQFEIYGQPQGYSHDNDSHDNDSHEDDDDMTAPEPLRVLRRRPGGDLRAVTNVNDLDLAMARRLQQSVASLTTYTDSIGSSYGGAQSIIVAESSGYVDVVASDASPVHAETFSLGAMAEKKMMDKVKNKEEGTPTPKQNLSLFSTHSSKPIMRPSFEAEAQKLALIPDDLDDDGGVEAALLKLEGKIPTRRPRPKLSMDLRRGVVAPVEVQPVEVSQEGAHEQEMLQEVYVGVEEVDDDGMEEEGGAYLGNEQQPPPSSSTTTTPTRNAKLLDPTNGQGRHSLVQSFLSDGSLVSYTSTPLLDRGLTDDGRSRRTATQEWTDRSILQDPEEDPAMPTEQQSMTDSQHPSYEFVSRTESLGLIRQGTTLAGELETAESVEQSFLDIDSDNDNASVISSELSAEEVMVDEAVDDGFSSGEIGVALSTMPSHLLREEEAPVRPASPRITLMQALRMPRETEHHHQKMGSAGNRPPMPLLTPETTPTTGAAAASFVHSPVSLTDPTVKDSPLPGSLNNKYSVHLPFILAFDSDMLAQQFTLVEKDALNEIDWKELIDMRWKNADQNTGNRNSAGNGSSGCAYIRSWVSFLRDTDARGVEVVIARFNIMVKWAVSQVVLTRDIEERARCLIKFIHIAAHCRRYRNFATMSQIAIALTSNEVGRLAKTWAMVPVADRKTLRELEALVSPTRNFYNMRAEMEGASQYSLSPNGRGSGHSTGSASDPSGGACIPFVGIYTHDLLFNAQKPSEIASSPTGAPLVNFERCRTAAGVVKTLLRLLEASMLYRFQPVEGVTERCLWMGALGDEEIRRLGEGLE
ncbi:uncharacterized protein C8A04DRAFT_31663 [Dichotomopilus funicola]|uniref:Guanine nucleotide exchange factor LTE1 n=1 Tax=Dichotomopilus funicola TaxID=1934379 RepID=A0AAN6UX39_9PEZI|nr:hypothetical protein C8A04DRAFT_31663 [Dichotomopilus funicola]